MATVLFATFISVGLPLAALLYASYRKRYMAFLVGVLAFVVSQLLFRIPILDYLQGHSAAYTMFSVTQPVLFAIVIGLSAGVVEELARYFAMRFLMKRRDWTSGFLFGAGHGGIEAVLFVGIHVPALLFSPTAFLYNEALFVGGIERFFAMVLHIGLSIIVLQGVVRKRLSYIILAILIHSFVDALIGILPLYVPKDSVLVVLEVTLAIIALAVFAYSISIKRKGVLQ